MSAKIVILGHTYGATGTPSESKTGDDQATLTEGELSPTLQTEVAGNCYAPIGGLKIVEFLAPLDGKRHLGADPDLFHRRGFRVIDEPCAGHPPIKAAPRPVDGHVSERARTPGEVQPGEHPVGVLSGSALFPVIDGLNLTEAERGCDDLRHIMRGGPNMASR